MRYRQLGKTGLMGSEIGLEAEWLERHSARECTTIIHVREVEAYETATEEEKNDTSVQTNAPCHPYSGQCAYSGHRKPYPMDIAVVNTLQPCRWRFSLSPSPIIGRWSTRRQSVSATTAARSGIPSRYPLPSGCVLLPSFWIEDVA